VVVALAAEGSLHRVEIDTSHFKYNASAEVEVWGRARGAWVPVLARTPLVPDTLHRFAVSTAPLAQLRLDAYPDGGLARFKAFGTPRETEPRLGAGFPRSPQPSGPDPSYRSSPIARLD
jgi:allantoicase